MNASWSQAWYMTADLGGPIDVAAWDMQRRLSAMSVII